MASEKDELVLQLVEKAKETGKVRKGANEATKALERGTAKAIIVAKDLTQPEIVAHMSILAKEKGIAFFEVSSKSELGGACGLTVPTSSVAILELGEAKTIFNQLSEQ